MMNMVYVGGSKGGSTKSATANLLCLGAVLRGHPAAYVVTDPMRKVRIEGRPYSVLDGRSPDQLALILNTNRTTLNGWLIIDGGGNRPAFDEAVAAETGLCLVPFKASEEDVDVAASDLARLPMAIAWPSAWPTNSFAEKAAQFYIDGLTKAFPLRVMTPPIPFVNSVSELLASSLGSPSTPVRSLARKLFDMMEERFEIQQQRRGVENREEAVSA
jgi:hypothetical protein